MELKVVWNSAFRSLSTYLKGNRRFNMCVLITLYFIAEYNEQFLFYWGIQWKIKGHFSYKKSDSIVKDIKQGKITLKIPFAHFKKSYIILINKWRVFLVTILILNESSAPLFICIVSARTFTSTSGWRFH